MTTTELHKAALRALGWRPGSGNWHKPGCLCETEGRDPNRCYCEPTKECPFEPPPITEEMFVAHMKAKGLGWRLEIVCYEKCCDGENVILVVTARQEPEDVICTVFGATPKDCREKAIVAVSEKK